MKKFLIITKSISGDDYTYFLSHPKTPTKKDLKKFLEIHATDKDEDQVYEEIEACVEIKDEDFLTI